MPEKLRGLLDSAKRKLGGLLGGLDEYHDAFNDRAYSLLGNAPQQFNAGAAAGTAGSVGDAAYIARLPEYMLKGSMPDPRTIPGTSDYIAAQAGIPAPQGFLENAAWIGGQLLAPGPGEIGAAGMAGGKLAMFLGAKAKTALPDVLEYAQAMEAAGKSADEIWQTTGKLGQPWFKGADGKWRFEISDDAAQVPAMDGARLDRLIASDPSSKHGMGVPQETALEDVLRHPELEGAYFQTREQTPSVMLSPIGGGQYTESDDLIRLNNGLPLDESALKSVTLHELQHAVQGREGFGRGGNPNQAFRDARMWGKDASSGADVARKMLTDKLAEMRQVMPLEEYAKAAWGSDVVTKEIAEDYARNYVPAAAKPLSPDMERAAQETISKEWYKRLAGEAEARNVQARMNMSMDERIALPPWTTQDVPTEQQIVRFGDGPAMAIEDFAARRAGKAKPYKELAMDEASRMQRAKEMGFDTPAVHWSRHGVDVNELDSGKFAIAPFDAVGTHVGTPEAAMKRFEGWASPERGAGVTYPVVIKSKKPYLDPSGKPWNEQQLTEHLREIGGYDSARASYKELNSKLREKIFADYDSIPYINDVEDAGSISYIAPPQNIRSRFAAFDPSKKDSANLLAGLAALGVGTVAVKSQQDRERRNGL